MEVIVGQGGLWWQNAATVTVSALFAGRGGLFWQNSAAVLVTFSTGGLVLSGSGGLSI